MRSDRQQETYAVVAKRASAAEVIALREIRSLPGAAAFPQLIDAGCDAAGPWVVTPFYPGASLPHDAVLPNAVYASLARLHLRHLGRTRTLHPEFRRVDEEFCRHALLDFAPDGIRAAQRADPHPVHERAMRLLHRWAYDGRIRAGLDLLPPTLLHGDAYGLNVVAPDDGSTARLVDWGSARVGPPMLDVVMSADTSSDGFAAYLQAWEEIAGSPLDPWQAAVGHAWATVLSNGMFVGAVAERFGPTDAERTLDQAEAALHRLGELLARRAAGAGGFPTTAAQLAVTKIGVPETRTSSSPRRTSAS